MKEKICCICGVMKPLNMYWKNRAHLDGHTSQCAECKKRILKDTARKMAENNPARRSEYYKKNRERELASAKRSAEKRKDKIKVYMKDYQKRNAHKLRAQYKLRYAVYKGTVKRIDTCEVCGVNPSQEAHHYDYSRMFDVVWVCRSCHKGIHAGRIRPDLKPKQLSQLRKEDNKLTEGKNE